MIRMQLIPEQRDALDKARRIRRQLHRVNYQPEWFGTQLDQRRLTHNLFISWPKTR